MKDFNKKDQALHAAKLIREASLTISKALEVLELNDLNLQNYPEYWRDFSEHPLELDCISVTDFDGIDVVVGEV